MNLMRYLTGSLVVSVVVAASIEFASAADCSWAKINKKTCRACCSDEGLEMNYAKYPERCVCQSKMVLDSE